MNPNLRIWFDGKLGSSTVAMIPVMAHTLHYGTGVFEGIRSYKIKRGRTVFMLMEHIDRLFRSASLIGIKIPFTTSELYKAVEIVLNENKLADAYIRPLVFYGVGSMGLNVKLPSNANSVHVLVSAWEWPSYFDENKPGINAMISTHKRVFSSPQLSQSKASGHYLSSCCAHAEAIAAGYDEALLNDADGYLAEASAANLFIVRNGAVYTPYTTSALRGITRAAILKLCFAEGYRVHQANLRVTELLQSDEVFLTGTACEVVPVLSVDGKLIRDGCVGPVTARLARMYQQLVRVEADQVSMQCQ